jgi:multicomponent K+:H+ antiporter subunit E
MTEPRRTTTGQLLPQPLLSVVLFAVWLLANNSISPGLAIVGAVLAIGIPVATQRFWPEYPRTVRAGPLLRLILVVLFDMGVANLRVARLILGPRKRLRPAFFTVPVTLREELSVTLLASVISLTPGTVSAELSPDRRALLVHGLDVEDEGDAIHHITERYERLLREVLE